MNELRKIIHMQLEKYKKKIIIIIELVLMKICEN